MQKDSLLIPSLAQFGARVVSNACPVVQAPHSVQEVHFNDMTEHIEVSQALRRAELRGQRSPERETSLWDLWDTLRDEAILRAWRYAHSRSAESSAGEESAQSDLREITYGIHEGYAPLILLLRAPWAEDRTFEDPDVTHFLFGDADAYQAWANAWDEALTFGPNEDRMRQAIAEAAPRFALGKLGIE